MKKASKLPLNILCSLMLDNMVYIFYITTDIKHVNKVNKIGNQKTLFMTVHCVFNPYYCILRKPLMIQTNVLIDWTIQWVYYIITSSLLLLFKLFIYIILLLYEHDDDWLFECLFANFNNSIQLRAEPR